MMTRGTLILLFLVVYDGAHLRKRCRDGLFPGQDRNASGWRPGWRQAGSHCADVDQVFGKVHAGGAKIS